MSEMSESNHVSRADASEAPNKSAQALQDARLAAADKHEARRVAGDLASQKARGRAEQLITRVLSGAIYAVATLGCLLIGRWTTTLLIAVFAWMCCSEFFRMMRMAGRMPNEFLGLGAAVLFPLAAHFSFWYMAVVAYGLMISTCVWYVLTPRANLSDVAVTIFGPLYTSLLFTSVIKLRAVNASWVGGAFTFCVMGSIWLNDTFAYLVGSRFGKHKLAPKISPKKSWEGFVGGMVASVVVWVALSYVFPMLHMQPLVAGIGGLVCGGFGVVGDLFESRIKRSVGVKDSGNIMPGHGGLLDRSDSMLFGLMAGAFILVIGGVL